MNVKASVLFASRLLFPRTGKKSNARRSLFGAFICIAISLVPLIMVLSVSDGMIQGITGRYIGLSTGHIECELYHYSDESGSAQNLIKLAEGIRGLESVKNAWPQLCGIALAAGKNGRTGTTVRAVENDIFTRNEAFASLFDVIEGTTELKDEKSAVVGQKFAELLNLKAGSTFRLITTKQLPDGKTLPRLTPFKVSGIVSCGYQELDALWVFIPLEKGFSILPVNSSKISILVDSYDAFSSAADRARTDIEENFPVFTSVQKWNEVSQNRAIFDNFESTKIMLLLIMILIILVASVNISSALVMLVMERRREIAILKSLGGSSSGITVSVLITGLVTGGLGVLAGVPAGLLCAVNFDSLIKFIEKIDKFLAQFFYVLAGSDLSEFTQIRLLDPQFYLQKIPLSVPLEPLMIICGGTLLLSLAVSTLPALKAGREKPLETMRKM
ncbi:MAG: ABC transporter permease [Treponema sp.]|nr:ABC transporter permease [Treponema sp.]